ncbi:general secretion pathway protein GspB [Paucibacter sp. M5-1]|uniref:general secretion pathway protein GspB n=1 Tax=Paucibacter sp. M5-1 TaxID=3015998 RepID=UPI0022B9056F|nr:general secretion pathway protein GspB [Paucibacter sp. M5-1]MCZ7882122.1 general secretion pathway protein GspB [Paucibacter sp. M5-1]
MSYILDALRRAESERERGNVPGLHANPIPADHADDDEAAAPARRWLWGAAALLLGAAGLAAWLLSPGAAPAPVQLASAPPPIQRPPAAAPQPGPELKRLEPAPLIIETPVETRASPAPPVMASAPTTPPAATERAVPALVELPEAFRRSLPPLATSGAMYSDAPAQRMLIVNGQLFREGDKIAEGLVLEQIQLKRAIFSARGQSFSVSY